MKSIITDKPTQIRLFCRTVVGEDIKVSQMEKLVGKGLKSSSPNH